MILFPVVILSMENPDDRQFMETMYRQYRRLMYRIAIRVVHDPNDVEDIINTACEGLIKKISDIRHLNGCTLQSYVSSTVRNTAINFVNSRNRRGKYVLNDGEEVLSIIPDGGAEVDRELLRKEDVEALEQALLRLSELDRDLLRMKYYDELTDRQIAQIVGVQESSIRMYLTRARRHAYDQLRSGGAGNE